MEHQSKQLLLRYLPHIYKDRLEPFPVRYIGGTVFTEPKRSESFPKWLIDPIALGAQAVLEYAVYYDYDIQHLYDLEHIWVAIDRAGQVMDCWCSFHGMRLRAAGVPAFRLEENHPVFYAQPGKHAMLPDPALFGLHPQFHTACSLEAGGGLLIPDMLRGRLWTDDSQDARIARYIRRRFAFTPSGEYVREPLQEQQLLSWPALLAHIPQLVEAQLAHIEDFEESTC